MNPAHLHLIVTHLPVLGSVFGVVLLLLALIRRSEELKRAAFTIFIVAALLAVPTYLTGQPASTVLMKAVPGMSMDKGDQHAEVAVLALVAASVLGVAALAGLLVYRKGKQVPGWLTALALCLAVLTAALMAWTANLGGQVRHTEIKTETPFQNPH